MAFIIPDRLENNNEQPESAFITFTGARDLPLIGEREFSLSTGERNPIAAQRRRKKLKILENLHGFIWQDRTENNCNTYFIDGGKKIVIDPGHGHLIDRLEFEFSRLSVNKRDIDVVIATHAHPDHVEAASMFDGNTFFTMNRDEYLLLKKIGGRHFDVPVPAFFLGEGELKIGNHSFQVIRSPGHSPGSMSLFWPKEKVLFTGDTVFKDSIGRTDLPGGNGRNLKESIEALSKLDAEYLLPGHGEPVIGRAAVEKNFKRIKELWFDYLI